MPITKLHSFDGEQLSVDQIHARVPAICTETIRRYLRRGINTKAGMLNFKPKAGRNGRGRPLQMGGRT